MGGLPNGWLDYTPTGQIVSGTRFIAFKCPLKETLVYQLPKNQWFTPQDIIGHKPKILLVIDLTNTCRYYDKNVLEKANITYKKIFVEGHITPRDPLISQFFDYVDKFLEQHPDDDSLIGVHCTHGVNRTGYFICKYMIDKMKIDPDVAIKDVGRARGHPIERMNYLEALKAGKPSRGPLSSETLITPSQHQDNWRNQPNDYRRYNPINYKMDQRNTYGNYRRNRDRRYKPYHHPTDQRESRYDHHPTDQRESRYDHHPTDQRESRYDHHPTDQRESRYDHHPTDQRESRYDHHPTDERESRYDHHPTDQRESRYDSRDGF